MKITKNELMQMIRECLREELASANRRTMKESLWTCWFDDRQIGTVEAATEDEALDKMMAKYPEYHYGLYDGCFGVELYEELKNSSALTEAVDDI